MPSKKILLLVGARPQFIKAAVLLRALKALGNATDVSLLHTGQHFDFSMSENIFKELALPQPDFFLGINGGTHGQNTGRMIEKTEEVMIAEKPDMVVVFGDTDSTLAGTLAASKLHIPVAHVEAGLRSFNRKMPEEINRIVTDHIADWLFTPTDTATSHALAEGIPASKIKQTGDVMYDAALYYAEKAASKSHVLNDLHLTAGKYVLATLHRAENASNKIRLNSILEGLSQSDLPVVLPLHPRTNKMMQEFNTMIPSNIRMIDPVGYLEMIVLEKNAAVIATDSGGVQKEAFFYETPSITMRDETEWEELVTCGATVLTGANAATIAEALKKAAATDKKSFTQEKPYGNGRAGELIAAVIAA